LPQIISNLVVISNPILANALTSAVWLWRCNRSRRLVPGPLRNFPLDRDVTPHS